MGRTAPPCNKDCEHCPFPDCVWDGLDCDDYREQDARDRELTQTAAQKKLAARNRAYYEANREKVAAQRRAYREANREKVAAQQRAYREANREKVAAQRRAYREANREKLAAQQRAYREAKKRSVEQMTSQDWAQWYRELLIKGGPELWDLIFDYMVDDDDINDVDLCRLSAEFTPTGGMSREV